MPGWSVRLKLADRQALVHIAGHRGLIVLAGFEGPEAWSRPRKSANYLTWDEVETWREVEASSRPTSLRVCNQGGQRRRATRETDASYKGQQEEGSTAG